MIPLCGSRTHGVCSVANILAILHRYILSPHSTFDVRLAETKLSNFIRERHNDLFQGDTNMCMSPATGYSGGETNGSFLRFLFDQLYVRTKWYFEDLPASFRNIENRHVPDLLIRILASS